jgi:hypothetical protein
MNCRAFDSLAPTCSVCDLPVHVAWLPPAPFCKMPGHGVPPRRTPYKILAFARNNE